MKISTLQGEFFHKKAHHIYIKPDPQLQDIIAHYTITFPSEVPVECENYHILPDGSGCIIFQEQESLRVDFWGAMDKVVIQKNDVNDVSERFFVEFLPTGLYQISGKAQKDFVDVCDSLTIFDSALALQLTQIYHNCTSFDELIEHLNIFFINARKDHPLPQRFLSALSQVHETQGNLQMKQLAQDLHISIRQLSRDFHTYLGLSGKTFANIVRFNVMVKDMDDNLMETALRYGYFDQAHFNKDFKRIVNVSPKEYKQKLSTFYNEIYKF